MAYGITPGHDYKLPFSDNITTADSIAKKPTRLFSDATDISDSFSRVITAVRVFSDAIDASDSIVRFVTRPFSDPIDVSDTIARAIERLYTESIDISEDFEALKVIFKTLTDNITVADSIGKKPTKGLTDTISVEDLYTRALILLRAYTDNLTILDSIGKGMGRDLTDNLTVADSIAKKPVKGLTDTTNISDSLSRQLALSRILTDTLYVNDDIFPQKYSFAIGDIQTDFASVLADIMTEDVTLRQVAVTTDSLGNPATATDTDVTIDCGIKYLTETDRQILGVGTLTKGELVGYFKENYTVSSVVYTVTVGDIIIRNDIYYRITKIFSRFKLGETVIYMKALLERLA